LEGNMPSTTIRLAITPLLSDSKTSTSLTLAIDGDRIPVSFAPGATSTVMLDAPLSRGPHQIAVEGAGDFHLSVQIDGKELISGGLGGPALKARFDTRETAVPLVVPRERRVLWSGTLVFQLPEREQSLTLVAVQEADVLQGAIQWPGQTLYVRGEVDCGTDGGPILRLSGVSDEMTMNAILVMEDGVFVGECLVGDASGKVVAEGPVRMPDVLFDETPRLRKKPADPCGKLVHDSGWKEGDVSYNGYTAHVQFRVLRYEFCVKVIYKDDTGHEHTYTLDLIGSGLIGHDPNRHVHAYGRKQDGTDPPLKGKFEGSKGTARLPFYGRMMLFIVEGCDDVKFIQFVKVTQKYSDDASATVGDWQPDPKGQDHYPSLPETVKGGTPEPGMYDAPGGWGPQFANKPDGTTLTVTDTFETYVCCGEELIGYWTWSLTATYTFKNGVSSSPNEESPDPVWHDDPATGENSGKAKCK
jgi:hypothetical protein